MRIVKAILGRLLLVAGGLIVTVFLLELGLQIGALVVRVTGREPPTSWTADRDRILCLGDSNTFGIFVEPYESYPARLEEVWNERIESPKVDVINLGYPGTNTSRIARDFSRLLRTLEPKIVIVMVGVNDFWTVHVPRNALSEVSPAPDPFQPRIFKLVRLIASRLREQPLLEIMTSDRGWDEEIWSVRHGKEVFELGFEFREGPPVASTTLPDLEFLVKTARELDVELTLMTYPSGLGLYFDASQKLRDVANLTGTELIDLQMEFNPDCPGHNCPNLLRKDGHPTVAGYLRMAHTIVEQLAPSTRLSDESLPQPASP